ncbi:hypothetical protein [Candidatus Williamhamiltonella defendens]|uniref:hypothetical protein n=1 Tax=Candidatus Williamhamiltonella defendens TaxID=138072 RepID=UPI001F1F76E9|nr:hypothetical protein [Candidatus Hamiltonella defensa]
MFITFFALLMILNLVLGPANYNLWDMIKVLIMPNTVPVQLRVVLWDIRMPMALMVLLIRLIYRFLKHRCKPF